MGYFPRGIEPATVHSQWVVIVVEYQGLFGASVKQEWYWEPFEWEGAREPVVGHGAKLLLYSVTGMSGAEASVTDIVWQREA
jgi:hypothetical protein